MRGLEKSLSKYCGSMYMLIPTKETESHSGSEIEEEVLEHEEGCSLSLALHNEKDVSPESASQFVGVGSSSS